jgi:hypothetical protein
MMLLEILYHSKEIYVCLYCILPLAAFSLQFSEIVTPCAEQIVHVIKKVLAPIGGLEESCLMYIGHWVSTLIKIGVVQGEAQQQIVLLLASRLAKAKMSSTAKVSTEIFS